MDLQVDIQQKVQIISLNRVSKNNAFDDQLIKDLQQAWDEGIANPSVRAILLRANGAYFSAGADLNWMKKMIHYTESENLEDALILAKLMSTIYHCPKPTIAAVQGGAYGGGAGLVATCDIAIAARSAKFCFSEVKLGLVPAVISPYVVRAIGPRTAQWLFMTAELFDAQQAQQFRLIQHLVDDHQLQEFALDYAFKICSLAPEAVAACKPLLEKVYNQKLNEELIHETARIIAQKRISREGQIGLHAFLNKEIPNWN